MASTGRMVLKHQGGIIGEKPTASIEVQLLGEVDDLAVASNENFCHEGKVIVNDVVVVVVVVVVIVIVVVVALVTVVIAVVIVVVGTN